jgi:hypothetical protein
MTDLAGFLFIVAVPLVAVGGGLVTLFAVGALFDALEHPDDMRQRIEAVFRQPLAAARAPRSDHYYRPHWNAR